MPPAQAHKPRSLLHPHITTLTQCDASPLAADGAAVALGLSNRHISPPIRRSLLLAVGGRYAALKVRHRRMSHLAVERRAGVTTFSARSRSRLLQSFARVDQSRLPANCRFITLTYPGEWDRDSRKWKRDLDAFGKRFRRAFPTGFFYWKLEPQRRGAPHYHLLAWYDGWLDYTLLAEWWYAVVGSGDTKHLPAGSRTEELRSWNGVTTYASKYCGKAIETVEWRQPGRFWGIVGRANRPENLQTVALTDAEFFKLRRAFTRLRKGKTRYNAIGGSHTGLWVGASNLTVRRLFTYSATIGPEWMIPFSQPLPEALQGTEESHPARWQDYYVIDRDRYRALANLTYWRATPGCHSITKKPDNAGVPLNARRHVAPVLRSVPSHPKMTPCTRARRIPGWAVQRE